MGQNVRCRTLSVPIQMFGVPIRIFGTVPIEGEPGRGEGQDNLILVEVSLHGMPVQCVVPAS